jgi:hypothetical protein
MNRERALKIVLVLVGFLFLAGIYPLTMSLWQQSHQSHSGTEPMMLSDYVTLGIFLLLAARNPLANRNLVAFTAWSSFAHAAVMFIQAFQIASERGELLVAVALLGIVGVALVALAPAKQSAELASAAGA